ncbi:hypothetical protein KR018_002608, partial [Drosophila ironensis]
MLAEYSLPPNVIFEREKNGEKRSPLGHLEIEVSRIRLKSIKANSRHNSPSPAAKEITAKIIWWGEKHELAGSVSCDGSDTERKRSRKQQQTAEGNKKKKKKPKPKPKAQHQDLQGNNNNNNTRKSNKLRYSVRSQSLALFLDYLRECPAIEIVACDACDASKKNDHAFAVPVPLPAPPPPPPPPPERPKGFGHTLLPVPESLVRKYAANYGSGCNFEHKTKIYALYRHLAIGGTLEQVQQQQQLKVGHIQLRFTMLFAEPPPPPKGHAHTHAHGHTHAHAHGHGHATNGEAEIPAASQAQVMPLPLPLPLPMPLPMPTALLQDQQSGELMAGE